MNSINGSAKHNFLDMIKEQKFLLLILGLQTFLLIWVYIQLGFHMQNDSESYFAPAIEFMETGCMAQDGEPILFRTPGYILIIAIVYKLSNYSNLCVGILQAIMVLLNTTMIYTIGKKYVKKESYVVFITLCYVFDMTHYYHTFTILSDIPFSFFVVSAIYWFLFYTENKKLRWLFCSFVLIQYALLIRPQLQYFNLFLAIVLVMAAFFKKVQWKIVAIYMCTLLTLFGGWCARNLYYHGQGMFSSVGQYQFAEYYAPLTYASMHGGLYGEKGDFYFQEGRQVLSNQIKEKYPDIDQMSSLERLQINNKEGMIFLVTHIPAFIQLCVFRFVWELIVPDVVLIEEINCIMGLKYICLVFNILLLIGSYVLYFWGIIKRNKRISWVDVTLFLLFAYLMVSTVAVGYWRYRIAFYGPFLISLLVMWRKKDFLNNQSENCYQ